MKQSRERIKATIRYCCIHKIHYISECPYCSGYQQEIDKNGR